MSFFCWKLGLEYIKIDPGWFWVQYEVWKKFSTRYFQLRVLSNVHFWDTHGVENLLWGAARGDEKCPASLPGATRSLTLRCLGHRGVPRSVAPGDRESHTSLPKATGSVRHVQLGGLTQLRFRRQGVTRGCGVSRSVASGSAESTNPRVSRRLWIFSLFQRNI